jgi:thiol-disulfide isomerase/thioredoxin
MASEKSGLGRVRRGGKGWATAVSAATAPLFSALLILVPLALALLAAACAGGAADGDAGGAAAAAGKSADFRLADLAGGRLGPPDLAGQVVLIDFWATWCVPCHAQADILKDLYPEMKGRGVEFLAVDVNEPRDVVEGFLASRPYPYPVLLDPDSEVADSLGVYSLPTLMVVDRQGRVSHFAEGIHREDELRRILAEAGAGT